MDEHGAEDTGLTATDVRRLDTLCWRALKNQTISRSKVGQEPRLYCRVEYAEESFHLGGLDRDLELDSERSEPEEALRTVRDLAVDIGGFVERLENASDQIEQVRVVASDVLQLSHGDKVGGPEVLYEALRERLGEDTVEVVNVYDAYPDTLPESDTE
ncbi:MAG: DUF694 family protein [halophilic archaeon J07HX64]|nr:MAG: DUF694 family protein [halophilic archaeon J07HX64]